jgi:hypothetical protein
VRPADAGLCAALDLEDDRLVAAVDGPSLPASERARPLNLLLGVWLTARGVWPVHAGAVAAAGRAALFLGAGGSGKSTTALLSARSLDFVGDDLVALRFGAGAIEARPLYATAALDDAHLGRVAPELLLRPTPGSTEDGKRILRVREQAARGGDVVALVLPRVVSQPRCRLVPARPREALLAAAPSSLLRRAVPAHGLLARLRELVERVPCYRLELGTRVADVPDLVLRAIEGRA